MSEFARNFMIGLVTIVGLLGLAYLLFRFGEFQLFRPAAYEVKVHMTMAGGIRPGSPIELDGVPIGEITDVRLDLTDMAHPVIAQGRIRADHKVPADYQVTVERALLAGTAILSITSPRVHPDDPVAFLPQDDSARIYVHVRSVVEEILAELDERTKPLLEALGHFNELAQTYTGVGQNINALIGEMGLTPDPDSDEPTLRTAVARLNDVLGEARSAIRTANEWLEDEQLRTDFKTAVTNANALIEQATEAVGRYGQLAETLEDEAGALVRNLVPVAEEMASTLTDVRRVMTLATEGRGTIAQLLNNPDLYESLLDAAIRLERALTEAQLLIQKFQAEGVPIRW